MNVLVKTELIETVGALASRWMESNWLYATIAFSAS